MPVTPQLVRFGLFELDLNTSELWKNGRKLNLQEQPARLLNLLLENPGEIVTRDKLKEALWSADTFVDFDHSLNAAVAKLRQALGDSAENPRFIETLARRGYRFIAPVEFVGNSVITPVQELRLDSLTTLTPVIQPEKKFSSVVSLAGRLLLVSILGGLALAAFALWLWHKEGRSETELVKLTEGTGLTTDPTVSADGKLLAYASDRGSGRNLNVWIQQLVPGGNAVQLTHGDVDESEPAFSPDGSKIVFRSEKDGGGLFVISAIGGEAIRLTSSGRNPRFSPDGRLVAYWLDASGTLYIIPAQGGEPRRVGSDLHAAKNPV
jgi:DNA-binding winged helix-turn-helix (wHTH) protein/Tol biopolymer transport system component